MYLERLEILGFKSFAKKTVFVFNEGVTAIVGPNGSGKSNIVDSIRWVLGEQKVGILRSERMENVIFNGSKTAKPMGMAEVSLTIKNTKNILPVEYSDVVITRRLFRSGESQYLLNNNIVRLKDILDLFMDTGMSPDAYSVIELSMVESILNGKTEDRRRIFEEAAGVTKYKQRRKAAFRKLEATEKDLLRVRDIIGEVEKNVASLHRQVRKAQRYQGLSEQLRQAEIRLATFQYVGMRKKLEPLVNNAQKLSKDLETLSSRLNLQESDLESIRTQLLKVEQQLSTAQGKFNQVNKTIQKKEEEVLLSRERLKAIDERNQRNSVEKVELHQRIEKLQKDRVQAQQSLQTLKDKLEEVEKKYWERKKDLEDLEKQVSQKKARSKESEKNLFFLLDEISNKKREEERLKTQKEHQNRRIQELIEEENELKKTLNEKTLLLEQSNRAAQKLSLELNDLNKTSGELEKESLQLQREAEEVKESLLNDRNRIEVCNHNIQLLQRLLETYEDYPEGVRHLMLEQGSASGFKGTLADVLSVAPEYKIAIESCLGEATAYLVTEDSEKAYLGINNLKGNKKGVVTFLPLDRFSSAKNHPPVELGEKVIGWADELVKTETTFRSAVQALLGNCLVVKDWQVAQKYGTQLSDKKVTIVTLDGEVIAGWGGIKGGSHGNQQDGLIGRTDQLKQFQQEKDHLEILIQNGEIKRAQTLKKIEALVQQKEQLSVQVKGVEKELTDARMNAARLQFEKDNIKEQLTKNKHERTELHNELQRIIELQTAGTQAVELAEQKRVQLEEESTILQQNLVELEQQMALLAQEVHNLNLLAVSLKGEYKNLEREITHNIELARQYQSSIESKDHEILEDIKQKEALTSRLDQLTGELEKDFATQEQSQKVVQDLERDRGELLRKIDEKGRVIRNLRYDKEKTSQSLHELELQISELKLKTENLKQRTKEEHNWDIKEEASFEPLDPQELEIQIERLKGRLKALGPVNMLALKEYQKEKERLDFLQDQQRDLLEAEKNLKETIELINQTARSRFTEIYEAVRKNFAEVFSGFFEQGEADLVINREADPLEADIEVVANPSGKRLNSLSLLSGGEKALTAISLLFAIYLIKPSPFCILDEVDAPLDDSNIECFVRALRKFSNNTQFIVVTHNKLTMKAADCLYGITMAEDAISKVVSVKIESKTA